MKKTSIVVGSDGQDGTIISLKLKEKNHKVIKLNKKNFDLRSYNKIEKLIIKYKPNNVFYFAAIHHSSDDNKINSYKTIIDSNIINFLAPIYFLQIIYKYHSKCKFFFASSSLIFNNSREIKTEKSILKPKEIYSLTKASTMNLIDFYRNSLNLFINVGIFFNHESEFRKEKFLSKKIVKTAVANYKGSNLKLKISNLKAKIDWGSAYDYMDAVILLQNQKKSDNYIIATGKTHSILDFVKITYNYLGLDYKKYTLGNNNKLKRNSTYRCGNPYKLQKLTGWKPKKSFKVMIEDMINYELKNESK